MPCSYNNLVMCGITGYVGCRNAPELLFEMLLRLEYRGYDSAGIAYISEGEIRIPKDKGKVSDVRRALKPESLSSHIGLGHTRWATHGAPSQVNAHPHSDCSGNFVVAHNGIIENYLDLKAELEELGHEFASETDTEVVAHLIEEYFDGDVFKAFERALKRLRGSYALTVLCTYEPDKIYIARNESPMLVGLGEGESFVASDAPAFLKETRNTVIMEDGDYGIMSSDGVVFYSGGVEVEKEVHVIDWDVSEAEKGGYHHFMLKEMMEEAQSARNALRSLDKVREVADRLKGYERICIVACGTAFHAGLVGKYLLESHGIPSECHAASEFRYSTIGTVNERTALVCVSQSGETADTLAAIKAAKERGAYVASIVNVVGSSITRVSDDTIYINVGPEIAVASTKAYIGQVLLISLLALHVAHYRGAIDEAEIGGIVDEAGRIPDKIDAILDVGAYNELAEKYVSTNTFFYIGRNLHYPTALEGALKIKEIAYVHAEGYPAGELKHGPLAVLDENTVVLAVLNGGRLSEKIESNINEARARQAKVITIGFGGDIDVPESREEFMPLLCIVPLHFFAYYFSVLKGLDPDKPRNLAKSVTVE